MGGWIAITVFVIKYSGDRIANKLEIKWKAEEKEKLEKMVIELTAEENIKLEKLSSEISREHSTFKSILESYSSVYQVSQERRIIAIEKLWQNMLKQRNLIAYVETIYVFPFPESGPQQLHENHKLEPVNLDNLNPIFNSVLECRPFLGEYLWSLYNSAYIFTFRIIRSFNEGLKNRTMVNWHNDEYLMEILSKVFTSREVIPNSVMETRELLEQKILAEMLKVTSGDLIAERNLSKAKEIQEAISSNPKENT
ncbi:hypothetical protein [Methanosarcina barkeri]|uniref:hypothetical protein n=1 Tax=Methanosarcina barkeri TaxID=2208 RepID=UPI0012D47463|nr:hypothetical protein [Methanosarcina barkeri]